MMSTNAIGYDLAVRICEPGPAITRPVSNEGLIAELGKELSFETAILDSYSRCGHKPIHIDLLTLCAAAEFADRKCSRRSGRWSRNLKLTIPVFERSDWCKKDVRDSLNATLRHLTGDEWELNFVQREPATIGDSSQQYLDFPNSGFIIPYSDGLDSYCVSEIYALSSPAVRVRISRNGQKKGGRHPFDRLPYHVRVPSAAESSFRVRGFKFAAITAIAAHLSGLHQIVIPESGQGALGPVLLPLYGSYADYRNHPTFLRKMERFIKSLLGVAVHYEQPRLWSTKGQTIAEFLEKTGKPQNDILRTRSCWQQRWNAKSNGQLRQCGLCSSCLLRRMSLHAAGVNEPLENYVFSDLSAKSFMAALPRDSQPRLSQTMLRYGIAAANQLHELANLASSPDASLGAHVCEISEATGSNQKATLENLRMLLTSHANEWKNFIADRGREGFLQKWTERKFHD